MFFVMIRRPPRSTRTDTSFPTRRSSDLPTELRVLRVLARLVKKPVIAEPGERFAERGRPLGLAPVHRDPLGREVDARARDAWKLPQRLLDLPDASTAADAGNRQIGLPQAGIDLPACEADLMRCQPGAGRHSRPEKRREG